MKIFKLSLVAASFLFIGCGGGSDSPAVELTSVKTVEEAKTSYKALGSLDSMDLSIANDVYNKSLQKMQKGGSVSCSGGGTVAYDASSDSKNVTISYSNCQDGTKYYNGTMSITSEDESNSKIVISDFTSKDVGGEEYMNITMTESRLNDTTTITMHGVVNQTSKNNDVNNISVNNLVFVEKDSYAESWSTLDGGINLQSKCVTGNYQFTTVEKLVDSEDGTDNVESGIFDINGVRYTFDNPSVTIKTATEEETLLQSELEEELSSNTCSAS